MNPADKQPDALADAYRKASAEEAGRPGAAIRTAILAEAAAAAHRRTPAANDSRYLWRGVAGVAVLGFALLMWQQMDHRMPGEAPVVAVVPGDIGTVKLDLPYPVAERMAEAPPQSLPAQPSPAADAATDVAAPLAAEAPVRNESARAASKVSALVDLETDADALLRQHFPQQYQSSTSHRLWLVQDGNGAVLRSGELAPDQDLAGLRVSIERELGGRLLRPWRIRSLRNAQGQSVEFAIAQVP
jgi:hypothetical protein